MTGKLIFNGTNLPDLESCRAFLQTPIAKLIAQMQSAKTLEERQAFLKSEAFQAAATNHQQFLAKLNRDGSFSTEDVPPGNYEFSIEPEMRRLNGAGQFPTNLLMFTSTQNFVVPPVSDKNDTTPIEAGTVEMKPVSLPTFPSSIPVKLLRAFSAASFAQNIYNCLTNSS